jgi:hypothetical protein
MRKCLRRQASNPGPIPGGDDPGGHDEWGKGNVKQVDRLKVNRLKEKKWLITITLQSSAFSLRPEHLSIYALSRRSRISELKVVSDS